MKKLTSVLSEVESYFEHSNKKGERISNGSVGWHLEHSILVFSGILKQLEMSNPSDYKPNFSLVKSFVLLIGILPRGKKAPERVSPKEQPTQETLRFNIDRAKKALHLLPKLSKKAHFYHPVFGVMNKKEATRFIEIHSKHHLKIVKEILNAK
jgi:hypothetical protein